MGNFLIALNLSALLIIVVPIARAQSPFYEGKTITVIAGTEPGGTLDMRIKTLTHFLKKYIPGEPTIITEYMPGAGGRKAANHIYRVARPDGLTIGSPVGGFLMLAVLKEPGADYDISKLIYLGAPDGVAHYVFSTRKDAGLNSMKDFELRQGSELVLRLLGIRSMWLVGCSLMCWGSKSQSLSPVIPVLK